MSLQNQIRVFQTDVTDARIAAQEFYDGIFQPNLELVVFFCSSKYDLDILASEIHRLFAGIQIVGCTTAGEIGPTGCRKSGLAGAGLPKSSFTAVSGLLTDLQQFAVPRGYAFAQSQLTQLESLTQKSDSTNSFAFMLIDGLSVREEIVSHTLQLGLNKIPIVGASAGDDLRFSKTHVYYDGCFYTDCAVMTIVTTHLPFKLFRTQHIDSTNKRMVVTEADVGKRIVKEIDGYLAADAYAKAIGVGIRDLTSELFAANPVVVLINGQEYVRSIQKVNDDASLTFYCAIDEGLVLRIAKPGDLKKTLKKQYEKIRAELGPPQLILTFDCIFRSLEINQKGLRSDIDQLFHANHVLGFCTYGEQLNGLHLNQTMTGIAIGEANYGNGA